MNIPEKERTVKKTYFLFQGHDVMCSQYYFPRPSHTFIKLESS